MQKDLLEEPRVKAGVGLDLREVMDIRDASRDLAVSPDTLYRYLAERKIPAFKLGNRWRFKKSALDRWMEQQSQVWEGRRLSRKEARHRA